ncbi:MAG TPA: hypothetical protein VEB87_06985, partial [Nitrososphaerales archaeon]|nr:hypothetical protein [Nitrososphaerales archaeon]
MPESEIDDSFESIIPEEQAEGESPGAPQGRSAQELPIFSILDSVDFSNHFVLLGEVGTGKSTVVPVKE